MACLVHAAGHGRLDTRHDQVKRDEGDGQRPQLRSEGGGIERRKCSAVTAIGFGVSAGLLAFCFAMTLSHGVLLLLSCASPGSGRARGAAQSGTNSRSNAISSEQMPSASVPAKPT